MDRSFGGQGCVVGVAGPADIGKSRVVREAAAMARRRGVEVFGTFCESHTSDVPSHVVARLLREATGITDLDEEAARARVRGQSSDADDDLLLVYDLLGIRETDQAMPNIDPDARGRRLTTLINVNGQDVVSIEHVDRLADDLVPDWPKGRTGGTDGIWRVMIDRGAELRRGV